MNNSFEKNLLSKFEKRNLLLFLSFAIVVVIGTFIVFSYLAKKSCISLISRWFNAEAIELQQGNLYSVLSKAQRTLTGSGLISSLKVQRIEDGKLGQTIFSFGNENFNELRLNEIRKDSFSSETVGLFKYQISYISEFSEKYIFIFIGSPIYMRVIWIAFLISFLGVIYFLYRIIGYQTRNRIQTITTAVSGVFEGRIPDEFIFSESPYLVKIISELAISIQEKKVIEIEHAASRSNLILAMQVSHDIRSPLSVLNILKGDLIFSSDEREQLFANAIQRINETANDLLCRTNKEKLVGNKAGVIETEIVYLVPIIESLIAEKKVSLQESKILINFVPSSPDISAWILPAEFKRVISNLLNNALEALNKDFAVVNVELSNIGDKIQLSITDNGKGMSQEVLSKLGLERFSHGKERSINSGNGLGYYHARQIVESFGGKLSAYSKPNEGTVVVLELNGAANANTINPV